MSKIKKKTYKYQTYHSQKFKKLIEHNIKIISNQNKLFDNFYKNLSSQEFKALYNYKGISYNIINELLIHNFRLKKIYIPFDINRDTENYAIPLEKINKKMIKIHNLLNKNITRKDDKNSYIENNINNFYKTINVIDNLFSKGQKVKNRLLYKGIDKNFLKI